MTPIKRSPNLDLLRQIANNYVSHFCSCIFHPMIFYDPSNFGPALSDDPTDLRVHIPNRATKFCQTNHNKKIMRRDQSFGE